ncbi:MAG: carbohydrate kinase family protein [Desulfovibrionaceae bacterium]
MHIYVSGSLAFDRIMTFPGRFSDHILPDKIHILNVCFLVDGLEERYGGCAGNIAYSLALLGERPLILAAAGKDFEPYARWLTRQGLSLEGVLRLPEEFTAGAYITTDQADNQITGFNPAAMRTPCGYAFPDLDPAQSLAIISPGNLDDMRNLPTFFRERGVPYIFDPGQQTTAFSGPELAAALTGAAVLVTNDYELELILKATGLDKAELLGRVGALVTTLAEHGSRVTRPDRVDEIPAVPVERVADPTGAGDAYRSGLLKGLAARLDLAEACRLGSVAAAYAVEQKGTQEHRYTPDEFRARYQAAFGDWPLH